MKMPALPPPPPPGGWKLPPPPVGAPAPAAPMPQFRPAPLPAPAPAPAPVAAAPAVGGLPKFAPPAPAPGKAMFLPPPPAAPPVGAPGAFKIPPPPPPPGAPFAGAGGAPPMFIPPPPAPAHVAPVAPVAPAPFTKAVLPPPPRPGEARAAAFPPPPGPVAPQPPQPQPQPQPQPLQRPPEHMMAEHATTAMQPPAAAQQAAATMMQQQEVAASHTMVLERANTKSTRLMRHPTIVRSIDQEATRAIPKQHSRFHGHPQHMRPVDGSQVQLTTTVLPNSPQLCEKFALPIGVSVRPLAPTCAAAAAAAGTGGASVAPPLVHFQEIDPSISVVRCGQCRSYINPFAHFTAPDRYVCSVCRRPNTVPTAYQCEVEKGQAASYRTDVGRRPELSHGTVDIIAPSDYVQTAPKRPTLLFLIDVSYQAVQSGMLRRACEGIRRGLDKLCQPDPATGEEGDHHVAFVAYDSNVYLFQLNGDAVEATGSPVMIAAPDLVSDALELNDKGEMVKPLELPCRVDDLLCSPYDAAARGMVDALLARLPTMFQHSAASESVLGPALNAAMSLLFEPGGKVFAFVASCPASGEGRLEAARTGAVGGDSASTQPASDFYKVRAIACSARLISVDLYVAGGFGGADVDLASIAPIARYTSGHITRVTPHTIAGLARSVEHAVGEREYGFDAVLRLRTPTHVQLKNFYGHFFVRGPDLLALPVCDSDAVYSFEITPTMTLPNNHSAVFMQIALMYTTRTRERRLRVITFGMEVTGDLTRVYNRACAPVTASFLAKALIDLCISNPFNKAIQSVLNDRVGQSLKTFRGLVSGMSRTGNQLTLPTSLASLPLYLTGMIRAAAAARPPAAYPETRADERVASGALLVFSDIDAFMSTVLPVCFCVWDPVSTPAELPRPELCSIESFKADCIYLVDGGASTSPFLWIGRAVPNSVLAAFGFYSLPRRAAADPEQVQLALSQLPPPAPEAVECATTAGELYANRQTLVSSNCVWNGVVVVNQDVNNIVGSCWENGACFISNNNGGEAVPVGISNVYEKVMHPLLVEDESTHEGAFPYGAVLLALRKAAEVQ